MHVLSPASVALAAFMLSAVPGAPGARPAGELSRPRTARPASDSGTWQTADLADQSLCENLAAVDVGGRAQARVALPNFTGAALVHYPAPRLV